MAAELAASERLNYLTKKQRAVSSRHSRQIIHPSNGNTFKPEQFVTIDIPGMQAATYLDFQNSYLKIQIKNNTDKTAFIASGYDLIEQIELLADGNTLSSINNYNVLVDQYMASEVGKQWKNNIGHQTVAYANNVYGTGRPKLPTFTADDTSEVVDALSNKFTEGNNDPEAQSIANGSSLTLCLPLVLTPLFSVNKYIPLVGRSTLTLRITFAKGARAFCYGAESSDAPTDAELIEYSPIEFIASQVRLSAEANQLVMANTRGVFELVCSDYRNSQGHIDHKKTNNVAFTTGFSFSSFDRISFSFYPHATLNSVNLPSIRNRAKAGLKEFALAINGEEFPKKRIDVSSTNTAEVVSELALAHRSLADFNHQSQLPLAQYKLDTAAATAPSTVGCFLAMLDLEAMQPHLGDSLYSGMTTTGATVQLVMAFDSDSSASQGDMTCHMFANFTTALVLDMNGSAAWQMSL